MASSPGARPLDQHSFDPSQPFKGLVICCTSVLPNIKATIAAQTVELGGIHKYDLTPDCTHLIVGEYDTPKYRHVAKERPDVKPMAAGWVTAVRNVWIEDVDIDFEALEKEWQLRTFETNGGELNEDGTVSERGRLLCCVTGFEDPAVRQEISDLVQAHGGVYTGDLTKRVTHLIAYKPEGRKYQAAKNWGIQTVSIEWVKDSVERGMILDEKCYDPVLPKEERGLGAWNRQRGLRATSLGKRLRDNTAAQEDGKKKLRRSTSMKLNNQRDNLWGDILGKPPAASEPAAPGPSFDNAASTAAAPQTEASNHLHHLDTQLSKLSSFGLPDDGAIFASCCFHVHGFSETKTKILVNTVASLGGLIAHTLDDVLSASGAQMAHRFMIVPQDSRPETHPTVPENIHVITEFYIERCIHKKYFFDPSQHVIGRPFPAFPIPGFEKLAICTSGFSGVDLNQLDKSVKQLGASYDERFTPNSSVLVCESLRTARKQKVEFALAWKIPVVSAEWLWECISAGFNVPIREFLFPELKQQVDAPKQAVRKEMDGSKDKDKSKPKSKEVIDEDLLPKPSVAASSNKSSKRTRAPQLDESAFAPEKSGKRPPQSFSRRAEEAAGGSASNFTTTFETALTHQHGTTTTTSNTAAANANNESSSCSHASSSKTPLSEKSPNDLNKDPRQPPHPPPSRKSLTRITSEVADSQQEADNDDEEMDDAPPPPPISAPPPESPSAIIKRLEMEKQARIAAERQAISNKLASSILLARSIAGPAVSASAPATAHEAETEVAVVPLPPPPPPPPPQEINVNTGASTAGPERRRREVFARAISNISTGSNTSSNGKAEVCKPMTTTTTASAPAAAAATTRRALADDTNGESAAPTSTQLDYVDPEARKFKARLMSKMLGADASSSVSLGGAGLQEDGEGAGGEQPRLTLAELSGGASGKPTTRRSKRR